MDSREATRHLEAIRTLMERAALYRRALAPVTLLTGALGCLAGVIGWLADLSEPRAFGWYWMGVAGVGLVGALLLIRRQALRDREPFWSPPMRRVTRALLPPLAAGGSGGDFGGVADLARTAQHVVAARDLDGHLRLRPARRRLFHEPWNQLVGMALPRRGFCLSVGFE